jgi:hypothetical protein
MKKKKTSLDALYGLSWAWSCVKPGTLIRSWGKPFPDLLDDLQGFPNEEINKSEILDMV